MPECLLCVAAAIINAKKIFCVVATII